MASSWEDDEGDHYEQLELPRDASAADIRRQYLALSRQHHPDKTSGGSVERFHRVQAAWETLGSPERRREYDAVLVRRDNSSDAVVDDDLPLPDLDYLAEDDSWVWDCRCGGEFLAHRQDLLDGCRIFGCTTCTLSIRVLCSRSDVVAAAPADAPNNSPPAPQPTPQPAHPSA